MIASFMRHLSWPGFLLGVGTALVVDRWGRGAVVKVVSAGMDVRDEGKAIYEAARQEVERVRAEAAAHQHAEAHAGHHHHDDPQATKRTIAQIKAEIAALQREVEGLEKEPAAGHRHPATS